MNDEQNGIIWIDPGDEACPHLYKKGLGRDHFIDGREVFVCQKCGARCTYPPDPERNFGRQYQKNRISCSVCHEVFPKKGVKYVRINGRRRPVCPGCMEVIDAS